MGSLKSLFRFPTSICLLILAIGVAIASPQVSLKNDRDLGFVNAGQLGYAQQQLILVRAEGSRQVFSYDVASRVGGVILQAIALPKRPSGKLNIFYDDASQDGHRFKIKLGAETSEILARDWEMIPLIRFVDMPYTAAVTLLGEPKNEAETQSKFLNGTMFIEINPAFRDTIIGNNFIFTDAMLVEAKPGEMRRVTENLSEPVPGYTDLAVFEESKSSLAADQISVRLSEGGWDTYIFTDVGVAFTFSIEEHRLELTGEPYYAFIALDDQNKKSNLNEALTEHFRNNKEFEELNPKIYELDRKVFQLTALLRNFKATGNRNWKALVNSVAHKSPEPSMETPRAWWRFAKFSKRPIPGIGRPQ